MNLVPLNFVVVLTCLTLLAGGGVAYSAPTPAAGVAIMLRNGAPAMIVNGSLAVRGQNGQYGPAPAGRYYMRDGKGLVVGTGGRLDAKSMAMLKPILPRTNEIIKPQQGGQTVTVRPLPAAPRSPTPRPPASQLGGPVRVGTHF